MDAGKPKRKTAIYCPNCGHMEVRARICDIEIQCRRCHTRFEAVIGPSADVVRDQNETFSGKPDESEANPDSRSKPNKESHTNPGSSPQAS